MLYNDFLNFLDKYEELRSFRKKIDYTNQNLQRIGIGSGRIVYDIDGTKVFKIAKNTKGVAQNETEADTGKYEDTNHITTKVFEFANDNSWIIAEKGKKVNEKRIIQLTGIPSLSELHYYLINFVSSNNGRGRRIEQNNKIVKQLDENEFVQNLTEFIVNYGQQPGDYNRASTYGEVLRDGQPTIVLTDYGLNDEVYDTYYNPMRKETHRMFELYNFADGNDDILSDISNVGNEVRHGMWAVMPYDVSDGNGVVNEEFISFISNRDNYPTKPLPSMPILVENFHDCVNNLKETLNHVTDKKKFYNNLLKLQEYLIEQNFYDREPIGIEEYVLNEVEVNITDLSAPIPAVISNTMGDVNYATELANAFTEKLNLNKPKPKGGGSNGFAFDLDTETLLKITADVSEADAGIKTMMETPKFIAKVFKVYKIVDTEKNLAFFGILQENIQNKPVDDFIKYNNTINTIFSNGFDFVGVMKKMRKLSYEELIDIAKHLLIDNPEANVSEIDRNNTYEYLIGLINIQKELYSFNIKSRDYSNPSNLGYKNNVLTFFDVGGYTSVEPEIAHDDIIFLPEGIEIVSEKTYGIDSFKKEIADKIANNVIKLKQFNQLKYVGDGAYGFAYDVGDDKIMKITSDKSEEIESLKIKGKKLKYLADVYGVYQITPKSNSNIPKSYVIIMEKLKTNEPYFNRMIKRLDYVFKNILGIDPTHIIDDYVHGEYDDKKYVIDKYMLKNSEDAKFYYGLLNIADEARQYGIESMDYVNTSNLGYKKNGNLGFFDLGLGDLTSIPFNKSEKIKMEEEGSAKFSTDGDLGQDGFPQYNQGNDTSPSIRNDLDANSSMYNEDLEYNHVVGDATDDEYEIIERVLSSMAGSSTVDVKKKCRLGGLGNTSAACNQGDINNLDIKPLIEDIYAPEAHNSNDSQDNWEQDISEVSVKSSEKEEIYRDNNYIVIRPLTHFAARKYGCDTNWCTSVSNPQFFNSHTNDRDFILYIINRNVKPQPLNVRNEKINYFVNQYGNGSWDNMEQDEKERLLDYSRIAISVEFIGDQLNVTIFDANDFDIYEFTGEYGSVDVLPIPQNVKTIIDNYIDEKASAVNLNEQNFKNKHKKVQDEGVADSYAEKEFNFQHPHTDFENKYNAELNKENIVFDDGKLIIIKNPKSLNNIFGYVRGIIDNEGNLYCEQKSNGIHYDMLYELNKLGLIKNNNYWDIELPEDFITVQRYLRTNIFLLGESNSPMYSENQRAIFSDKWDNIASREVAIPIYQEFLDKAKQKNPNFNFINELIQYYHGPDDSLNTFYGELSENIDINKLNRGISKDEMILVNDFPLNKLSVSKGGISGAIRDINNGEPSKTNEPVLVFYNIEKQTFLVEDGYHRVAEAHLNKEKTIPVQIYSDNWSDYVANISPENKFKLDEILTEEKIILNNINEAKLMMLYE